MCEYVGHRDGVWQVSHSRHGKPLIATASAGKILNSLLIRSLFTTFAHNMTLGWHFHICSVIINVNVNTLLYVHNESIKKICTVLEGFSFKHL